MTLAVVFSACSCDDDADDAGGGGIATVSSTVATTSSTGGAGGGDGGDGGAGGVYVCPSPNEGTVFALTELRFTEPPNGWKSVGLNLDGLVSDGNSTDVCQPNAGGNPNIAYVDGDNGIDNAFGRSLLPMIVGVIPDWTTEVNSYLEMGRFNAMLKAYCIPPTGDALLVTKVFGGTDLGSTPDYNGTDVWPVARELLGDPTDPESSTLVFENSSVSGNTFDSGPGEEFVLFVPVQAGDPPQIGAIKLSLHSARLVMTLSEDRKSGTGVLAGVLNTEEAIDQVKMVLYMDDRCDDPNYDAILTAIRQSSDIMTDGGQNPGLTCDGISFGVAFDMAEVQLGSVGPAWPVGMSCP